MIQPNTPQDTHGFDFTEENIELCPCCEGKDSAECGTCDGESYVTRNASKIYYEDFINND